MSAGSAAQPGPPLAAKAKKKPRQLLGKKAAGKKKPGQEDAKRMDIPREAFVGARKGLIYCLVGLISQKRYSSQVSHPVPRESMAKLLQPLWPTSQTLILWGCIYH